MHHEALSDNGNTNKSMQLWLIVVQLALNWHAEYNSMSVIRGAHFFASYLCSQKLPFLKSNFHHNMLFRHSWDWTLVEITYRLFLIGHELQRFEI
jgi:hypothetical protein